MKNNLPEMFDVILIDEAQDFHKGFFQFAYRILKPPKRLIWAYDELQSLEDVSIPTAQDIFGTDENGIPLVDLDGFYSGRIEKDFVLFRAYRNPRIILMIAHFFGMGIFRRKGTIQFVPNKDAWEDLGYKIIKGKWEIGEQVVITREEEKSPNIVEKYVDNPTDLIEIESFNTKEDELSWIADKIANDIQQDEIQPEDILVIGLNDRDLFDNFENLKIKLLKKGVQSIIIGKDVERDTFRVPNHITLSTVFKAKGNEAQVVYIFNFENSEIEDKIIQSRNMAFASMTRSKGWLRITGTGSTMKLLKDELKTVLSMYPNIEFKVPDIGKIKRYLDNIEYEKRRKKIRKSERELRKALEAIERLKGQKEISRETIKRMKKIVEEAEGDI